MSVASAKWEVHECRSEDGVLYTTDLFVSLTGTPKVGYQPGPTEPLAVLLSRGTGDWIEVDPQCRFQDDAGEIVVEAGGGSFEGEGFVAVTRLPGNKFVWMLHLSNPEPFTSVTVDGSEVVALAEEYPYRNEFRIPLSEPHRLRVLSRHDT